MADRFFTSVKNGAQRGRIYGDNATLVVSWPAILLNVFCVGIYRGDDDWKRGDLNTSFSIHKFVSTPIQLLSAFFGAIIGAISAIMGRHLEKPIDNNGWALKPIIEF